MFKPVDPNPDFIDLEKKLLDHWYKDGIVERYLHKNDRSKQTFSFQDGPITANNPMGVHHAWGRSYKDLWQKFFNLIGRRQRFQNGFDCQGLWVEVEVEKELGLKTKKDIENLVPGDVHASIAKFVSLCKARVNKFSAIQTEQSKRLGYLMDWDHSYFTMSDANNYMIWHFLKVCDEHGWIYKGHESVPWCPRCETAISQHEMLTEDYKELVHESVYLKLRVSDYGLENKQYLLVWTTTPWTIPANIAVAVDKNIDYALVERENGEQIWLAKDTIKRVFTKEKVKTIKVVKGKVLDGLKYEAPFDAISAVATVAQANPATFHRVVMTDATILPVTTDEGTGMVHTAVSAGTEDFRLGKKYGLPMIPVIADNADYLPGLDWLSGKNAKKHPELIIDFLKTQRNGEFLLHTERYKHRYPACWRCKTELVWKVADEWYIAMDRPSRKTTGGKSNQTLRERMMAVTKKIKWMPEFGLERELDWLKNMHDWLISKKNRYWGLALPIYECRSCGKFNVLGSKTELRKRAVAGWEKFAGHSPHKPYIDDVMIACVHCGKPVRRIADVGNPWLDAGIVEYSTVTKNNQGQPLYLEDKAAWRQWFPADFITESFPGQFKNWFYAQIAMSTVLENTAPFRQVLGFATMMGEDGRPMHKSWGNYIDFNEGAEKIGVDVMRWTFARHNPSDNLLFGYKKTDEVRRQFYLILWNIYKFFVEYANLDHCQPNGQIKTRPSSILDAWILSRFSNLIKTARSSYEGFNVYPFANEAERFVNDLSTWYIRRSRERVWVNSDDQADKQAFYATLHQILTQLAVILSPVMPFITDRLYTGLTGEMAVHLASWPESVPEPDNQLLADMQVVREVVEVGHRVRRELKLKLKQPLAAVALDLPQSKKFQAVKRNSAYIELISAELNVKKTTLRHIEGQEITAHYDIKLTPALVKEGKVRELVRRIQAERKTLGISPEEPIKLTVPAEFKPESEAIAKKTLAKSVSFADQIKVCL